MNDVRKMGRVTIPTDMDAVPETLDLLKRWGADAIRDCDGTEFPQELKDTGAKIYATYYTTRKDNAWAKDVYKRQMLDNALEAAAQTEQGEILCSMQIRRQYLAIRCENTYSGTLRTDENGELLTTKDDASDHGFGLMLSLIHI